MIRVGVAGLGKMGLSHLAMIRAHPDVEVAAVADPAGYPLDVLAKYAHVPTYGDYDEMLADAIHAVVIATPTRFHAAMVDAALDRGVHVFCEKPLCLTSAESAALAARASDVGVVTQVGYHNRFVGAFREVKRLLDRRGDRERDPHARRGIRPGGAAAQGIHVAQPAQRGRRVPVRLRRPPHDLATWYMGEPSTVGGSVLGRVFSEETEDEVFSTLYFPDGATGQASVNWSDESCRKMTTKLTLWGTAGRIYADRQECIAYLRDTGETPEGYQPGWNVRYTTELTEPVWYYLRGEEYSAQLDYFVQRVQAKELDGINTFASAAETDRVLERIIVEAAAGPRGSDSAAYRPPARRQSLWGRIRSVEVPHDRDGMKQFITSLRRAR